LSSLPGAGKGARLDTAGAPARLEKPSAVILVIGLVIAVATYSSASSSPADGAYAVAYGPMILGVVYVIRGISVIARAQKLN